MNWRLTLLAVATPVVAWAQPATTMPPSAADIREYDTRGSFSTSASRSSVFRFPESGQEKGPDIPTFTEVDVGDMIARFVKPTGVIIGQNPQENKVMVGGQFFGVSDTLHLEAQVPKDFRYTYPSVDLVVREITDTYVEFYHKEQNLTHRVALSFQPELGSVKRTTDLGLAKITRIPVGETR